MPLCPLKTLMLESTVIFNKNLFFILMCHGFIIATLK